MDGPDFKAIVTGSILNSAGQKVDFCIYDLLGTDGKRYITVTYNNEVTREGGTALSANISKFDVTSTGCSYSGNMILGKESRAFSIAVTSPTQITFDLAAGKHDPAVDISGTLTLPMPIYLNPS